MDIYLIYKTDVRHSYNSRDLIGVATTIRQVIKIINQQANKEHETIDEDQLFNLQNIRQTQGYSGTGEFHYEPVTTNTLL